MSTMAALLETLASVSATIMTMLGDIVQFVMNQPLCLIPVGVVLFYTAIKTFKKLVC